MVQLIADRVQSRSHVGRSEMAYSEDERDNYDEPLFSSHDHRQRHAGDRSGRGGYGYSVDAVDMSAFSRTGESKRFAIELSNASLTLTDLQPVTGIPLHVSQGTS